MSHLYKFYMMKHHYMLEFVYIIQIQYRLKNKVEIEVDGGIKLDNAQDVIGAGADTLVVGSGIFKAQDPLKQLSVFKLLQKH